MAPRPSTTEWNREDRDLLVELRTEMSAVRTDIKDLKDGVTTRLGNLEQNTVSKIQFDDHELRLRVVETNITRILTWGSAGLILLTALDVGTRIYFHAI